MVLEIGVMPYDVDKRSDDGLPFTTHANWAIMDQRDDFIVVVCENNLCMTVNNVAV
jgi:hypothetical protein